MSSRIAAVYLRGQGLNKIVPASPGRSITFVGGKATIVDERDMHSALRMPGVHVEVEPRYIDFVAEWAKRCGPGAPAVATVSVIGPDADTIHVGPPPEYVVTRDEVPSPVETPPADPKDAPPWKPSKARRAPAAGA